MAKKTNVKVVTLQCTEDGKHRVQTTRNLRNNEAAKSSKTKNSNGMLELMKYNSRLRKHTLHRELKKA